MVSHSTSEPMGIVTDLIYIVLAALCGGFLAHLLKQPLVFGYILAGIIVGPYTGGLTVERIHDIEMLAEVGVALLLFTLGLEFSFGEFRRLAAVTFFLTPLQLLLSTIVGYFLTRMIGLSVGDALWVGAATSLSSTMVVLKMLAAKDALDRTPGRIMLAILIAQDIAVIPLMLLLPELTSGTSDYLHIATALFKSAIFLSVMYFGGTWLFPRIFKFIARWGTRELFFLSTLSVAMGAGYASYQLGLSFALGAFVAGMLLSETDFNHQALSDVASLRDLFGLIFFASVGMLFDPVFFWSHLGIVAVVVIVTVGSKALITASLVHLFGYERGVPSLVGLGLAQVGEFAFVIANVGNRTGNLSHDSYSLLIAVAVVSMVLTPLLFGTATYLGARVKQQSPRDATVHDEAGSPLREHVVIVGGGVVGRYLARVLTQLHKPYVVIENDHKIVAQLRDEGLRVIFGDGTRPVILQSAQIARARLALITTTSDDLLPLIVREVSQLNDNVPLVVRVEEVEDVEEISLPNVLEVVQPQREVAHEMMRQALLSMGVPEQEIFGILERLRLERRNSSKIFYNY